MEAGDLIAGRFELVRPLGQGGLAQVLEARDRETGARVALKVLHAHLAFDETLAARFRDELRLTRGLDHPGIVRVYDLHEHEGRPLFSMELLEGETLQERLERGKLPAQEARRIAAQAAKALSFAHRRGVVHRDLKPANLFLCTSGAVKLLDFGLARAAGAARLTAQGTVSGTLGYMAPELLSGQLVDGRADLYALGATLFELFTGQRAFGGTDPYAVLHRQRAEAPSPRAVDPQVSPADDELVRRALQPDPERRFLDAQQLLVALEGGAVPAAPPSAPALSRGDGEVWLYVESFDRGDRKRTRALLQRLGVRATWLWPSSLDTRGEAPLLRGVSQAAAEELAALCQELGLATLIRPVPAREAFTARHWRKLVAGILVGLPLVSTTLLIILINLFGRSPRRGSMAPLVLILLFSSFMLSLMILSGLIALAEPPPLLPAPPAGDGVALRIAAGIDRRVAELRASAAPALRETAERMGEAARSLAQGVRTSDPGRDAAVQRLLEIAAALDEARAALRLEGPPLEQVRAALDRLRAEIAQVRLP